MFKWLKMIGTFKDVRAEVKAQGTLKNVLLSRKFWGLLWVIGAFVLDSYFGVKVDEQTQQQITNAIVVGISSAMLLFGMIMQIVSYVKTIVNAIKKNKEKNWQI